MRKTPVERNEMQRWEKAVSRTDAYSATDVYLEQKVVQISQPLMLRRANLLLPHEVRVSPCGKYVQWRGKHSELLKRLGFSDLDDQVMKEWVSPIDRDRGNLLQDFILLSGEARDESNHKQGINLQRIVEFVTKWGPLNIYPETHSADTLEDEAENCAWRAEPLSIYREHAKRMWGMLAVAAKLHHAKLHQGDGPTSADWDAAADYLIVPDPNGSIGSKVGSLVSLIEDHYIRDYQIKPMLTVQDNRPMLTLDISSELDIEDWEMNRRNAIVRLMMSKAQKMENQGLPIDIEKLDIEKLREEAEKQFRPKDPRPSKLLNCLVLQLLATVTMSLYQCSICGTPYVPTKRPRSENHFCIRCQGEAHRLRSKNSYQNRKAKGAK